MPFRVTVPSKDEFADDLQNWAFALEDVPTKYLTACFSRAIRAHTSKYPVMPSDLLTEFEEMRGEVVAGLSVFADREIGWANVAQQLEAGRGAGAGADEETGEVEYMTSDEWRKRHGLPPDWKVGTPYPPGSDLYGTQVPEVQHPKPANYGKVDRNEYPGWHRREKAPWEIWPDEVHPEIRTVMHTERTFGPYGEEKHNLVRTEYIWFIELCPEINFGGGIRCPGFVLEHHGPKGERVSKVDCPIHAWRRTENGGRG